jgi:Arc/MetJ-type ribon-helix-helix transcriptional regulator
LVKSSTCITLDRAVLRWIQGKVEEGVFASRSHAIEYAVRQLMRQEKTRPNPEETS